MSVFERMTPPTRRLAMLAAVTVLVLIAAVWAMIAAGRAVNPEFEPEPMFPGLEQRLDRAATVTITRGEETVRLRKVTGEAEAQGEGSEQDAGSRWVLADPDGYPVRIQPLRNTFVGLTELQKLRPKTANPEWHAYLRLVAPEDGGEAVRIEVRDAADQVLAALLVGEIEGVAGVAGQGTIHARKPGENQTWLVQGTLTLETSRAHWIESNVLGILREEITGANITPPEGPAYRVVRVNPASEDFTLASRPEGRTARSRFAVNAVGSAIANLEVEDVRPEGAIDFTGASYASYAIGDISVTAALVQDETKNWWARFVVLDTPPRGMRENEAEIQARLKALKQRTEGYVFEIPDFKAAQMTQPLERLLEPLPEDAQTP